jgi:hypothetical protein
MGAVAADANRAILMDHPTAFRARTDAKNMASVQAAQDWHPGGGFANWMRSRIGQGARDLAAGIGDLVGMGLLDRQGPRPDQALMNGPVARALMAPGPVPGRMGAGLEPGTTEHVNAAMMAYSRNPNMGTAVAADNARYLFEQHQAQALQSAQMARMGAETQGINLTNQGIPLQNQAQADRLRAESAHLAAQTRGIEGAGELGQPGRDLSAMLQAGLLSYDEYQRRRAELRAVRMPMPPGLAAPPAPMASVPSPARGPQAPPTAFEAEARLRGQMPDLDAITGPADSLKAQAALARAIERSYPVGPGHEGEPLDADFRSMLRGRLGDENWSRAMQEPTLGTWGFGYPAGSWNNPIARALSGYNPVPGGARHAEEDYRKAKAFAQWARGGMPLAVPKPPSIAMPKGYDHWGTAIP